MAAKRFLEPVGIGLKSELTTLTRAACTAHPHNTLPGVTLWLASAERHATPQLSASDAVRAHRLAAGIAGALQVAD